MNQERDIRFHHFFYCSSFDFIFEMVDMMLILKKVNKASKYWKKNTKIREKKARRKTYYLEKSPGVRTVRRPLCTPLDKVGVLPQLPTSSGPGRGKSYN